MIKVIVYQVYTVGCDWCSRESYPPLGSVEGARSAAENGGFRVEKWREGLNVRELWLCPECLKKSQDLPEKTYGLSTVQ